MSDHSLSFAGRQRVEGTDERRRNEIRAEADNVGSSMAAGEGAGTSLVCVVTCCRFGASDRIVRISNPTALDSAR